MTGGEYSIWKYFLKRKVGYRAACIKCDEEKQNLDDRQKSHWENGKSKTGDISDLESGFQSQPGTSRVKSSDLKNRMWIRKMKLIEVSAIWVLLLHELRS